jgi:hypothetical protein
MASTKYHRLTQSEEAALAKQGAKRAPKPGTLAKAIKAAVKKAVERPLKEAVSEFVLPKSLAACADALYNTREKRLAHDRDSTVLKKDEAKLREHLIAKLSKGEESGVQGQEAFAYVDSSTVYTVRDWAKVYAAIVKEYNAAKTAEAKLAAFRFLNKAISKEPMEEVWENGKTFPGVERIPVKKVNISKRKGKR